MPTLRRVGAVMAVCYLVAVSPLSVPAAGAITPPSVDGSAVPDDGEPGPDEPLRMQHTCAVTGVIPGSDLGAPGVSQKFMDIPALWKSAGRGGGVSVAIIDTGVNRSPRLPHVRGGGDFVVAEEDGLRDCDSHGTVIASIIAGQPSEGDAFTGVAPDAEIISIRQSSEAYVPANPSPGDFASDRRAGTVSGLARAVVHAANSGAKVANVSIVACVPVLKPVDQTTLGAALRYAREVKDMVIVVAAGNVANQDCAQNPDVDPTSAADPRNWAGVVTVSTPSWFSDYVLSVAATDGTGSPAIDDHGHEISLSGPWVGVAAPGVFIQGLDERGAVINGTFDSDAGRLKAMNGTSFSAAYVSALAVLIRGKYPNLSAAQVIRRIEATAHSPAAVVDNRMGFGAIDPLAALNADVAEGPVRPDQYGSAPLVLPPPPPKPDRGPMVMALAGTGALAALLVLMIGVVTLTRKDDR